MTEGEAQVALAEIALELVAITDRLQQIHDALPPSHCLATIGLVLLMIQIGGSLPEPTPEERAQWEAERRQRQEERREREELEREVEREKQAQRDSEQRRWQEQQERERQERFEERTFLRDDRGIRTLTAHVYRVHHGSAPRSAGSDRHFPLDGATRWEAERNLRAGFLSRVTIYRERDYPWSPVRFAIEQDPAMLGSSPDPGCYRYLGVREVETTSGVLPVPLFIHRPIEHPACTGRQE